MIFYYQFRDVIGLFIEDLTVNNGRSKRDIGKELLDASFELADSGYVEWKGPRHNTSEQKFHDTIDGKDLEERTTHRKEVIFKE